jgi:hypothetical protein
MRRAVIAGHKAQSAAFAPLDPAIHEAHSRGQPQGFSSGLLLWMPSVVLDICKSGKPDLQGQARA